MKGIEYSDCITISEQVPIKILMKESDGSFTVIGYDYFNNCFGGYLVYNNVYPFDIIGYCAMVRDDISIGSDCDDPLCITCGDDFTLDDYLTCVPQSDETEMAAHGHGMVNKDQAGNVIVSAAREASGEQGEETENLLDYVSEDVVGSFDSMTDRWFICENFQWDKNKVLDTSMKSLTLPRDIINAHKDNVITFAPFNYHRFWRGDIEVKVQVNSNKFQVGQLQVSWYYGASSDQGMATRRSIYCLSQTMHGIVDAGGSNEVVLYIPYKNQSPVLCTKDQDGYINGLDMGELNIRVLSQLNVAAGGNDDCSCVILVRFHNNQFTATMPKDLPLTVNPQMEGALAIMAAEKLLNLNLNNTDNPPNFQQGNFIVPTASHSFAVGTNSVEPINPLRLDARGQTQSFGKLELNDHSTFYDIARVYALIHQIKWNRNDSVGTQLWRTIAAPDPGIANFRQDQASGRDYASSHNVPPVFVLTNLFAQWRGSIEYRFDLVASNFHTGRIMVAYLPGMQDSSALININMLKSCMHMVFDLQEKRSFTFVVPYVSRNIWQRRAVSMTASHINNGHLGSLVVFVECQLNAPVNVPMDIDINIYMRAGTSFELAIPIQPAIGLDWVRYYFSTDTETMHASNEDQGSGLYVGTWSGHDDIFYLRWGTLAGRVAEFPEFSHLADRGNLNNYYWKNNDPALTFEGKENRMYTAVYFAIVKEADIYVAVLCNSDADAVKCQNAFLKGKAWRQFAYQRTNEGTSNNTWSAVRPFSLIRTNWAIGNVIDVEPQMERENTSEIFNATRSLKSTNFGGKLYGESFRIVKDLCRRYQYYGSYVLDRPPAGINNILFTFPAMPQGLHLEVDNGKRNYTWNKCRQGTIPIILSGFKYYRGSIRYRIICPSIEGCTFWVQHRPEIVNAVNRIHSPSVDDSELDMLAHGYGMYLQCAAINGILEFEVPFYQIGQYGLIGKVDNNDSSSMYNGNGLVVLGHSCVELPKTMKLNFQVFYSLADDFEFNTFQGFPPMISAAGITEDVPNLQRVYSISNDSFDVVPNGLGDYFTGKVVSKWGSDVKHGVYDVATRLLELFRNTFSDIFSEVHFKEFGVFLTSQLAHLVNNFNGKTVTIVIISIFTYIGINLNAVHFGVQAALEQILNYLWDGRSEVLKVPQNNEICSVTANNIGNMEVDENLVAQYVSCIYTGLCVFFSIKDISTQPDLNYVKYMSQIFNKSLSISFRSGIGLYMFIRNHILLVRHIITKLIGIVVPANNPLLAFQNDQGIGYHFIKESLELTTGGNFEENYSSQNYIDRLVACESVGKHILLQLIKDPASVDTKMVSLIQKQLDIVIEKNNELRVMGHYPCVRRRPLHIAFSGKSGVGKSGLVEKISHTLLRNIAGLNPPPDWVCMVDSGANHWNMCNGKQPVLWFDDLWAQTSGSYFESMVMHYFIVNSEVPFCPPMASLDKKEMRYNPEIVVSTTNVAFPNLHGVHMDAINRRRNILAEVISLAKDPLNNPDCQHCKGVDLEFVMPSDLYDYHHVGFYIYSDPKDPDSKIKHLVNGVLVDRIFSYVEFEKYCVDYYRKFYAKQMAWYQAKIQKIVDQDEEEGSCTLTLEEKVFMKMLKQDSYWSQYLSDEFQNDTIVGSILKYKDDYLKPMWHSIFGGHFLALDVNGENSNGDEQPGTSEDPEWFKEYLARKHVSDGFYNFMIRTKKDTKMIEAMNRMKCILVARLEISLRAKINLNDLFGYFDEITFCSHSRDSFYESNFYKGDYCFRSGSTMSEDYRCCEGCLLNYASAQIFLKEKWVNSFTKRTFLKSKNTERIPRILLADATFENLTWLDCVRVYVEKIRNYVGEKLSKIGGWLTTAYNFVSACANKFLSVLKNWFWLLLPFIPCAFGVYTLNKVDEISRNNNGELLNPQAHTYNTVVAKPIKTIATENVFIAQSSSQAQHLLKTLDKNMIYIQAVYVNQYGDCVQKKWKGIILYMRKLLFLRHYVDVIKTLPKEAKFYLSYVVNPYKQIRVTGKIEINFLDLQLEYKGYGGLHIDSNFVVVNLPSCINPAPNITKFFASVEEHGYVNNLIMFSGDQLPMNLKRYDKIRDVFRVKSVAGGKEVYMSNVYTYDRSGDGLCGSVILCPDLQHPIVGIHVAGSEGGNSFGLCEIVTRENFHPNDPKKDPVIDVNLIKLDDVELEKINLETVIYPLGTVPSQYEHHQSTGTQYKPSLIAGAFEVRTTTAPLDKNDVKAGGEDPLKKGCEKHGLLSFEFPRKLVHEAMMDFKLKIIVDVKPVMRDVGVLSLQTAICGDSNIPEFTPLEWSSSEGFPMVKQRPQNVKGKQWLFEMASNGGKLTVVAINEQLAQIMKIQETMRDKGMVPQNLFTDLLKDELVPIEKAYACKTRVFSTAPVQFVIQFRQYFGDFMAAYRKARFNAEHGIGVNPDSYEWTYLAKIITQKGPDIIAGDYSHFGYTLNAQFVEAAFNIMIDWYEYYSKSPNLEKEQRIREVMKNEILNVTRLAKNFVYKTACGIPSGFPATDIINSMVNSLYIRSAWSSITKRSFYEFNENVRVVTYGDDLIMNVSPKYIETFNTETLFEYFKSYNIKFTDVDKDEKIVKKRTLDNVTFLKRGFKLHPYRVNTYLAPLDIVSVEGACNWIHKDNDSVEATLINCKASLELAYGHGKEEYDRIKQVITTACLEKMDCAFDYFSWEELDERNFGK